MHDLPMDTNPDPADIAFLEDQLYAYNSAVTGISDGAVFAHFVRDQQGAIIAGIYGWTWGGYMEIKDLWVHEDQRGQGYGTRLLSAAEATARSRGCARALLDTHSFQAPEFYKKRGYAIYAQVDNYPQGHAKLFLHKDL